MGDEVRLHITLPVDDEGMLGRQCANCDQYFKLKLGTGIQDITTTTVLIVSFNLIVMTLLLMIRSNMHSP